ncbi:MAG: hypothetical protein Q9186_003755 [Xanthomendoza sp. 1 TL-2023]
MKQPTSVNDVAMTSAGRDSRDMTGVASQLTSEWVAKEAFRVQPSDTPLDGVVSDSLNGIEFEQPTPSKACNATDALLSRSRRMGQCSHLSGHEDAEKTHNALEVQVAKEEAAFDSAVFHLDHQEYRKAKTVLRQLSRIRKNGDSDYKAKLYLLLAKAYQGQGQSEKAWGIASVSVDERQDLHGESHHLVEESAELLIAILIELGNNLEANALRKMHFPRRSYTAVFVGLALKVGAMANSLSYSMTLRRSLSMLEYTQQWFLAFKLLPLLVRTICPEKRLAAGKSRVRWTCSYGQRLYDDFIETRPGAANELRAALHTFDRQRPTGQYPAALDRSYPSAINTSGNSTRESATSPAGAVDRNFKPPTSIYDPRPTSGGRFSTTLAATQKASGFSFVPKHGIDRQAYCTWILSQSPIQFELHPSDLVDVRKVPDMGTNIGWGIHPVEGWATFKLWLLALAISFFGGMVFAVTWSVMKRDIQGAFGVAAYFVALAGLGVGTAQAYLN